MVAKEEEVGEGWTGSLRLELQTIGLPWCSDGEESACSAGAPGMIPGLGRPPGEGNGSYSSIHLRSLLLSYVTPVCVYHYSNAELVVF